MKISEIIKENPYLLLVLEHFGIDDLLHDKNVAQLCQKHGIDQNLFTGICNLYNGFKADDTNLQTSSMPSILRFLNNSHSFYLNEKYPEIIGYIKMLGTEGNEKKIKLVESFFNEYIKEVKEHLDYEEDVAFPYLYRLIDKTNIPDKKKFSATTYLHHHTDIETKLEDLKNLLLEHLQINKNADIKRKLLFSLFELEFDLRVHSQIEEQILIPLALSLEREKT